MLQLVDVEKSYRLGAMSIQVLRGVCLEVAKGDLLSIMGPSGSGKSTLMNIIGLLGRPTAGSYFLNGRNVRLMKDRELSACRNANIGFVFQSFQLLGHLTALENVAVPLVYRGMGRAEIRRRARTILEKVGMGERTGHKPGQLSGGQKQRVAIARALVGDPAVVLADEPTGALDEETADEVMQLLIQLNQEDGITVVIITHDPSIARQCTRQTRICDGVLREITQP
ncbi:MAG: ABC transporter ATP-binding protein [Aphanocapsa feldmannii 288cV]|nr:MAG: ABC transporter ATP-binding protein [Aphanocapsa feldmannii 288cV]